MKKKYLSFLLVLINLINVKGQTVGLIQHDSESLDDGYVLFAPLQNTRTYLIDKCGKQVKTWDSTYKPGVSVYLLPDGTLLRTGDSSNTIFTAGGTGGIIEKIDWDGNVIWSYTVSDATKCQHHDIRALPNGNILVIAWDSKTSTEAINAGRYPDQTPENLWSEQILEIQPVGTTGGNIVWEWHLWDHLVQEFDDTKLNYNSVANNPQLVNINYYAVNLPDWIHMNSIDYNPALDQILLSSFTFNEIWIIDHSTTTAEAASHTGGNSGKGGDLLYRLGNPSTYNADTNGNVLFYGQHNAHWIDEGLPNANQIIVHNNGFNRIGGNYSTVEIIDPPINGYNYTSTIPYLPYESSWNYNAGNPNDYYAPFVSSAQQLSNGNVLICNGPAGVFFEVNTSGETVWKYNNPVNHIGISPQGESPLQTQTFRSVFYPFDYSGFNNHSLTSGNTIENSNILSENCNLNLATVSISNEVSLIVYPNPANDVLNINLPIQFTQGNLTLTNSLGQTVYAIVLNTNDNYTIPITSFAEGMYYLKLNTDSKSTVKKILINH